MRDIIFSEHYFLDRLMGTYWVVTIAGYTQCPGLNYVENSNYDQ